jgi:hypothetical protein
MQTNLTRDDFEEWLFLMSDKLEAFEVFFKKETGKDLDYSVQSINEVEAWLLTKFESPDDILKQENKEILDLVIRYIGDTFRKNLKAKWTIDLENEKNAYYQLPVITAEKVSSPIAPHTLVTASLDRRRGTFIPIVLNNAIKEVNK